MFRIELQTRPKAFLHLLFQQALWHIGGAQSCPVLDLLSSLCSGEAMTFAPTAHIATWRSLVFSLERECQKKIKLLLCLPSSSSLLRGEKKWLTQSMTLILSSELLQ